MAWLKKQMNSANTSSVFASLNYEEVTSYGPFHVINAF